MLVQLIWKCHGYVIRTNHRVSPYAKEETKNNLTMLLVDQKTLYKNSDIGSYLRHMKGNCTVTLSTPVHETDDGSFIIFFFSLIIIFWVSRWCKISMKISVKMHPHNHFGHKSMVILSVSVFSSFFTLFYNLVIVD